MSAWIEMISDRAASAELREVLELARTPHGTVDNVMRVHSLRPATMRGHVALYRAALHDKSNTLPTWLQETISSYVSILNNCAYSLANHWANARHLIVAKAGDESLPMRNGRREPLIRAELASHGLGPTPRVLLVLWNARVVFQHARQAGTPWLIRPNQAGVVGHANAENVCHGNLHLVHAQRA